MARLSRRAARAVAGLACTALLAGCGGASATTGGAGASGESVAATGTKGENPGREGATHLHLGRGDCEALAARLETRLGIPLRLRSQPRPPLSDCHLSGAGASVDLGLDSSFAAHQRYENRIVEQAQFGFSNPATRPQPLTGVGEPAAGEGGAEWVPAYHTLFAVRGNRWLTVSYGVSGPDSRLRAEAAALTRLAFRLSAR